nr:glutamate racemase [uncultured Sellimonas sp.]
MNSNKKTAPVGVFDSGVGGLTVTREIMRQLPNENMVYFGDTARVPYGSKSKDNIIRYSRQIIRFLRTKDVKAIVIACNTASALALDVVKEETDIPIMGVIVPGAAAAVRVTKNKKIGVIGTEATIRSHMYSKVMKEMLPGVEVIGKPCPLFVPIVEEGFAKHKIAEEVIDYYLASMKESDIDTMILGCTHYPLLRSRIMKYLGDGIQLVNPAYETAMELKKLLQEKDLLNEGGGQEGEDGQACANGSYEFYVSDTADKFKQFANSILPYDIRTTQRINIEEY